MRVEGYRRAQPRILPENVSHEKMAVREREGCQALVPRESGERSGMTRVCVLRPGITPGSDRLGHRCRLNLNEHPGKIPHVRKIMPVKSAGKSCMRRKGTARSFWSA